VVTYTTTRDAIRLDAVAGIGRRGPMEATQESGPWAGVLAARPGPWTNRQDPPMLPPS
jgi:hypothetical protein